MPLFLTSQSFDGLRDWLERHGAADPAVVVTTASAELPDQQELLAPALQALREAGLATRLLDVGDADPAVLSEAGVVLLAGGDPFRLLQALQRSGAAALLRERHLAGVPLAGQSAGALVCGPNLEPARLTSPFAAPATLDLTGLGLTAHLVLPHHDQPGRAARHRQAAQTAPRSLRLTPLWDDETLLLEGEGWQIARGERRTRPARPDDAPGVAAAYLAAARAAWSAFLGEARLATEVPDPALWARRIADGGDRVRGDRVRGDRVRGDRFLVTEDAQGVTGFVLHGAAADGAPGVGEIELLYTHPRVWGDGTGRRLLARATWEMLRAGYREAVLWTEHRNQRALAIYERNGWALDGGVDERDYLGVPIRNLRHRLDLPRRAGA